MSPLLAPTGGGERPSKDQGHQNDCNPQTNQARGSDRGKHFQLGQHDEKDQEVTFKTHTETCEPQALLTIHLIISFGLLGVFFFQYGDGAKKPSGSVLQSGETV